jgi:hypothetical protein
MGCLQDSHFRVDQVLLQALILVKHLKIITYCLLTVCVCVCVRARARVRAYVTIFLHKIS